MENESATIRLRAANMNDLELLNHWDRQQHVIDADPNDDWEWETELQRNPPWREQLIAELNGKPIGFVQIIDPEKEDSYYWGNVAPNQRAIDIWIGEKENLGKGYGTEMMRQAIAKCFENPSVTAILIDPLESNARAIRFYEKIGFKFLEHRTFDEDKCAVYMLNRYNWESD
ncbi:GNAT family N-acetyltransferase [Chondrinema litorale]|uniref:GNAT family N-acetyltransferase n=1 Tax=Chondrinema litorale TaxID=2994555 RepID=UPI002542A40B|nr:GNAT family N-acetyltransferase [Chondrinema litorale]UZR99484.1 GNAT family N-acetyltransferase [Chondrinema litorale]